jgi:hypothetical protein
LAVLVIAGAAMMAAGSFAQSPDPLAGLSEEQKRELEAPFVGVTNDGHLRRGLFQLAATGVSTDPVRAAAVALLNGLLPEQRSHISFPVDDREWRLWINTPQPARQGVSFEEMSPPQRELALGLLRASLSAQGYRTTTDIMKLNGTLADLTANPARFGEWKYWITLMGTPSSTEPWGWQLDGHHCIINFFVLGDQVVMTPTFMGSEPVRAVSGRFGGTAVLQDEQDKGLALLRSLDVAQRERAIVSKGKAPSQSLAAAYRDNVVLEYVGIRGADLNAPQRTQLLDLIGQYVQHQAEGHARVRMAEVTRHLDDTYFGWMGSSESDGVFYYRIQSPVILIEFDHQPPVIPNSPPGPTRNHIHTVVRTPNGNDYGKDLLRQHFAQHPHAGV